MVGACARVRGKGPRWARGDVPTPAPSRPCSEEPRTWLDSRKEVIQPQLPLRLPCYDFTPITDPTLDGSPSCELGPRLQVLPAFVV